MQRYAIYYAPNSGPFADFTAGWLGWDLARGIVPPRALVQGLPADAALLTEPARKYGFHGTLKAPFRMHEGRTEGDLHAACFALAQALGRVRLDGLMLQEIGGFLALIPKGETSALIQLASEVVVSLDSFRAPLSEAEISKRRPEALTSRQRDLLGRYGYPYVLEEFQFHLTLTGALSAGDLAATKTALTPHLAPLLPQPFILNDLCLCGEGDDGLFRILHRYALTG